MAGVSADDTADDRDDTRMRIIAAATDLLTLQGRDALTTRAVAAAAIALQAVLPEATVLTAGERALMEEWLARLAATEPQAVAASTRSAPSPRLPGRTRRGPRR